MKVFGAEYYGFGGYYECQYVVVANTEQEALELLLEAQPNTSSRGWSLEEVDTSVVGTTYISQRSSYLSDYVPPEE